MILYFTSIILKAVGIYIKYMQSVVEHKDLSPHIFSLRFWIDTTDPKVLKKTFDKLLGETKYIVLNFSEHFFPVQGYTAIWLLAESHLAIHTFPQHGWSYVELSGCNAEKTNNFKTMIKNLGYKLCWDTECPGESFPTKTIQEKA